MNCRCVIDITTEVLMLIVDVVVVIGVVIAK